MEDDDIRLRA
jgi:hypothetical protein